MVTSPAAPEDPVHTVHRLRDLDRRGRVVAALCALALMLAPALAFAWAAPDWAPAGDTALMALRSLDVGTERTPLTGQPSSSAVYTEVGGRHADHPGPLHFFLMAPTIRAVGPAIGMLSMSVLITGGSVLIAAWAVFRQLGPAPGLWAAVVLGGVTFTTGATSLVHPVSSNIAGYPLLCSAVLAWCLLCGDIRLLPLTTAVVTFTGQQHLSVLPALTLVSATGLAGLGYHAWGRGWIRPQQRRSLARWVGASGALALVLWSPVIVDQLTNRPGNIMRIARFAGDSSRSSLGIGSAFRQVANVLGLPPLLGRQRLDGFDLLSRPGTLTWITAAIAAVAIVLLGAGWRQTHPRRAAVSVMAGALVVGGLVNGSSVPDGLEGGRLVLYHWAFPLALLAAVTLGLGLADLAGRLGGYLAQRLPRPAAVRPTTVAAPAQAAATVLALTAIVVPAALNPTLDRPTSELSSAGTLLPRSTLDALADEITATVPASGSHTLVLQRGGSVFDGIQEGVALALAHRGMPVRYTRSHEWYVHDSRLVDRGVVTDAIVIAVDDPIDPVEVPGEVVSEVWVGARMDDRAMVALDTLTRQIEEAGQLRFGSAVASGVSDIPAPVIRALESGEREPLERALRLVADAETTALDGRQAATLHRLVALRTHPRHALLDPELLQFLSDHPLAHPELDDTALETLRRAIPEGPGFRVRAHRLTRDQVLAVARPGEL